jgi:TetR/AcrR family transcriptional regulator
MKVKLGKEGPDVRARLLAAAVELFSEQGVAGTPVAEIARRAGVTSAMVHYYFKTKDQLLDAVVEEKLIGQFIAFVAGGLDATGGDPFLLTEGLVLRIVEASDLMPWLPPLWIREVASEGGALREKLIRRIDLEKQERFKACIAAGQKQGIVNPGLNAQLLFISVIGLTMLPLSMAKNWDRIPIIGKMTKTDLARHVVALLMHGLSVPDGGGKPEQSKSVRRKP